MRKKVFLAGIIGLGLIFALVFSACKTDDDDSGSGGSGGGGGGSGSGMGTITITGIKAGLNTKEIVHSTVTGTHNPLTAYTLQGGQMSGTTFDSTGYSTISGSQVSIPVRGSSSTGYGFSDGTYNVQFTITGEGNYNLTVNFSGSSGTATATGTLAP